MNIALIGYGRMGKEIEKIAIQRGHSISLIVDVYNRQDLTVENLKKCEVAVEFTIPDSAVENYYRCFEAGIPVVSGTTGWISRKNEVEAICKKHNGTFFYASNFSIGVNLFFRLNTLLARLMASQNEYNVGMTEIHHKQKLDAPSGTAITLAGQIIENLPSKKSWISEGEPDENEILIRSERTGTIPGTHIIRYDSDVDYIEITHSAKNRKGLALGAVLAAEFCLSNRGILTMNDMLKI